MPFVDTRQASALLHAGWPRERQFGEPGPADAVTYPAPIPMVDTLSASPDLAVHSLPKTRAALLAQAPGAVGAPR